MPEVGENFAHRVHCWEKDMAKILAETPLALNGSRVLREKRYMFYNGEVAALMEFRRVRR